MPHLPSFLSVDKLFLWSPNLWSLPLSPLLFLCQSLKKKNPFKCSLKVSNLDWPMQGLWSLFENIFEKEVTVPVSLHPHLSFNRCTTSLKLFSPHCHNSRCATLLLLYSTVTSRSYTNIHWTVTFLSGGPERLSEGATLLPSLIFPWMNSSVQKESGSYETTVDPSGSEVSWNCVAASY